MNLQELKTEIDGDPESLGYAGKTDAEKSAVANDQTLRDVPNTEEIGTWAIFAAIDKDEYVTALATPLKAQILSHILSMGMVNPSDPNLAEAIKAVFGVSSDTVANLAPLRTRKGSRAEELWGQGARVTPSDVANARRLP